MNKTWKFKLQKTSIFKKHYC